MYMLQNKISTKTYFSETRKVLYIILFLNIVVLGVKIVSAALTSSLSIWGDSAHSAGDALNNIVGIAVMRFAIQPPDKQHPYGHGKFETLAAFGIVIFLVVACVEIIQSSILRLLHPVNLPLFKKEIVVLLLLTLIVNLFVWLYERNKGKVLGSDLLIADSSHTASDVLITFSVLASQFFIAKKFFWIDPIVAILISVCIARAAFEIFKHTVPILVDEVWIEPAKIKKSALQVNGVLSCYDVYSRKSPYRAFIECKIKVQPKDLYSAHKLADEVEEKLKNDFGECKVNVHVEP